MKLGRLVCQATSEEIAVKEMVGGDHGGDYEPDDLALFA